MRRFGMASRVSNIRTRNAGDIDVDFPAVDYLEWENIGHLPTNAEVIGAVKGLTGKQCSADKACGIITEALMKHWVDRNIYTKSKNAVRKKMFDDYAEFVKLKKRLNRKDRVPTPDTLAEYEKMKAQRSVPFEISIQDDTASKVNEKRGKARLKSETAKHNVTMSSAEKDYLKTLKHTEIIKITVLPKKE